MKGYIPNWIYLYEGISILLYSILDNMDGKQARRTHSSSPLGLLFDHGCDSITSCVYIFVFIRLLYLIFVH